MACDETFDSGIEKWDLIVMTYVRVVNGERAARFQRGAQTRRGLRNEVHVAIVPWSRDPSFAADDWTRRWPQIQADMGLAQNTVDACGRGLEELRSHNPPARA